MFKLWSNWELLLKFELLFLTIKKVIEAIIIYIKNSRSPSKLKFENILKAPGKLKPTIITLSIKKATIKLIDNHPNSFNIRSEIFIN